MKACLIGVGGAGGRLVDAVAAAAAESDRPVVTGVYAFDTDRDALDRLDHVPGPRRHHLPLVGDGPSTGSTRGRRRVAGEALDERLHQLVFDFEDDDVYGADVLVFAAGLGGGVGAGCTAALANRLSTPYPTPTLTVGVLPDRDGSPRAVVNAAASIDGVWKATERLLLVDDERRGDPEAMVANGPTTPDDDHEAGTDDTAADDEDNGSDTEDAAGAEGESEADDAAETRVERASVVWGDHRAVNHDVAARLVALFAALPSEAAGYDARDFLLDTAGQLGTLGRGSATPTEQPDDSGGLFSRLRGKTDSVADDSSSLRTALAAAGAETLTLPTDPSAVTTAVAAVRGVDDSTHPEATAYLAEETTAINVGVGGWKAGASVEAVVWYSGLRDRSRVEAGTATARSVLREASGESGTSGEREDGERRAPDVGGGRESAPDEADGFEPGSADGTRG